MDAFCVFFSSVTNFNLPTECLTGNDEKFNKGKKYDTKLRRLVGVFKVVIRDRQRAFTKRIVLITISTVFSDLKVSIYAESDTHCF